MFAMFLEATTWPDVATYAINGLVVVLFLYFLTKL